MSTRIEVSSYNEDRCSICCTADWSGSWRGDEKLVLVCRECAIKILPALIADATWSNSWRPELGARDWAMIETVFWHAQTLNVRRNPYMLEASAALHKLGSPR